MTKKISADEMISRIYNMTRGMVSPAYVGSEMKTRKASTSRGGVTNRKMGGKIPAKKKK